MRELFITINFLDDKDLIDNEDTNPYDKNFLVQDNFDFFSFYISSF